MEETNKVGDTIVEMAREKIIADGWEGAMEAGIFGASGAFERLTEAVDRDAMDQPGLTGVVCRRGDHGGLSIGLDGREARGGFVQGPG